MAWGWYGRLVAGRQAAHRLKELSRAKKEGVILPSPQPYRMQHTV